MEKRKYALDRIEEGYAVLLDESQSRLELPVDELNKILGCEAAPNDIIECVLEGDKLTGATVLREETARVMESNQSRLRALFNRNKNNR